MVSFTLALAERRLRTAVDDVIKLADMCAHITYCREANCDRGAHYFTARELFSLLDDARKIQRDRIADYVAAQKGN